MQSLEESIESARKRTKCWIVLRLCVGYGMKGIHCFCLGYTSEILFQHGTPGVIQMRLQSANINWELLEWDLWLLWPWHPSTWLIHGSNEKGAAYERVLIVLIQGSPRCNSCACRSWRTAIEMKTLKTFRATAIQIKHDKKQHHVQNHTHWSDAK